MEMFKILQLYYYREHIVLNHVLVKITLFMQDTRFKILNLIWGLGSYLTYESFAFVYVDARGHPELC